MVCDLFHDHWTLAPLPVQLPAPGSLDVKALALSVAAGAALRYGLAPTLLIGVGAGLLLKLLWPTFPICGPAAWKICSNLAFRTRLNGCGRPFEGASARWLPDAGGKNRIFPHDLRTIRSQPRGAHPFHHLQIRSPFLLPSFNSPADAVVPLSPQARQRAQRLLGKGWFRTGTPCQTTSPSNRSRRVFEITLVG